MFKKSFSQRLLSHYNGLQHLSGRILWEYQSKIFQLNQGFIPIDWKTSSSIAEKAFPFCLYRVIVCLVFPCNIVTMLCPGPAPPSLWGHCLVCLASVSASPPSTQLGPEAGNNKGVLEPFHVPVSEQSLQDQILNIFRFWRGIQHEYRISLFGLKYSNSWKVRIIPSNTTQSVNKYRDTFNNDNLKMYYCIYGSSWWTVNVENALL